jgi:hypothetical protein
MRLMLACLAFWLFVPAAVIAQPPVGQQPAGANKPPSFPISQQPKDKEKDEGPSRRPPIIEYALALLGAFVVLAIICIPSRKG